MYVCIHLCMYMYMYIDIDMQLQNHTNTIIKPKHQTKERLRDHTMNNHEQSTISGAPGLQDQDRFWRTNGNWEKKKWYLTIQNPAR